MASKKSTQPRMSAAETKEAYSDLDQAHSHCLLLITTCTQLGNDLRNVELLKAVESLSLLTDRAQKVAERLPGMRDELTAIRERDLAMRTRYVTVDNIMQTLSVGQAYEAWVTRFQKGVAVYLNLAVEQLECARQKLQSGSNA
jgi:hypothetical protein